MPRGMTCKPHFLCTLILSSYIYAILKSYMRARRFFALQTQGAAACGILSAACSVAHHVLMPIVQKARSCRRPANGGGNFAVQFRSYLVGKH